jgi:hypothetical protein
LHVYPLGGLRKSAEWFDSIQSEPASGKVNAA